MTGWEIAGLVISIILLILSTYFLVRNVIDLVLAIKKRHKEHKDDKK